MSLTNALACRKFSLLLCFMLILQVTNAQNNFNQLDNWLKTNLAESGGRAVLVLYKSGKIIYNKAENELTSRQKMVGKFIAKRQGKDAGEMLQDFSFTSRQPIASCSKWLSAALVMTFVDEEKFSQIAPAGKIINYLFLPVRSCFYLPGTSRYKILQDHCNH